MLELVRLDGERARTAIELLHDAPVYRLRGDLLPFVFLRDVMEFPHDDAPEVLTIVVLSSDGRQFGLVVDGVDETEEIVVKPLGRMLRSVPIFSGATIMGDGRVALILDITGIAAFSPPITAGSAERDTAGIAFPTETKRSPDGDRVPLLIVATGDDARVAIPLADVARLEELARSTVERARSRDVVQYRGEIMPLVEVSELVGGFAGESAGEQLTVVVHAWRGRQVGIVVDRIVDIVETVLPADPATTLIVADRVTELLDVGQALAAVVGSLDIDLVEVGG